jgi:large subunit ribosomal protein L18
MAQQISRKLALRQRRKMRIRKKVEGTTERPRLTITRSARHVYAQVIDDRRGVTLAAVHSFDGEKRAGKEVCGELGKKLAASCKEQNISKVVFDKNGYAFHGRVKAFADGAREGGLDF